LNFVFKFWKVLENIWEVSRASPGQNSEVSFFNNISTKTRHWYMKSNVENQILSPADATLNNPEK